MNWDDVDDDYHFRHAPERMDRFGAPDFDDRPEPGDLAEYGKEWRAAHNARMQDEFDALARAKEEREAS